MARSAGALFLMVTVSYRGKEWALAELARKFKRNRRTVQSRLDRGMPIEDALKAPLRTYPNGVKRPREPRHKPLAVPSCDRCGADGVLVTFAHGGFSAQLCRSCRDRALEVLRRWLAMQ